MLYPGLRALILEFKKNEEILFGKKGRGINEKIKGKQYQWNADDISSEQIQWWQSHAFGKCFW
jgi:hypothetical protein